MPRKRPSNIRCDVRRVYDLTSARRIPVHKEGAGNLYLRCELDEWVRDEAESEAAEMGSEASSAACRGQAALPLPRLPRTALGTR